MAIKISALVDYPCIYTNKVVVSLDPYNMSKNLYVPVSIPPASIHLFIMKISPINLKFLNDLWQVGGFLRILRFHPPIKLTHNIAEILLKVALSTINLTLTL